MSSSEALEGATAIVTQAAIKLREYGEVEIEQLTDNLDSYSGPTMPDIVFTPTSGPYKGVVHVVEFKSTQTKTLPSVVIANAIQHKRWLEEANPKVRLRFALSTNARVPEGHGDFQPITEIQNGEQLASKVIAWSKVEEKQALLTNIAEEASDFRVIS